MSLNHNEKESVFQRASTQWFYHKHQKGKVIKRQPRGRPRLSYYSNIQYLMGFTSYQNKLKNTVRDRHVAIATRPSL